MKLTHLGEPFLEFLDGARHVDPRHGIADYGPADATNTASRTIRIGIVGTAQAIDGLRRWLDQCRRPIEAKASHLGHLYLPFPGFEPTTGFHSTLEFDGRFERKLRERDLTRATSRTTGTAVKDTVNLYMEQLAALHEEPSCDVVLVARPDTLSEHQTRTDRPPRRWRRTSPPPLAEDFRAQLKAEAMRYRQPLQIIRRTTWDPTYKPEDERERGTQDAATKAWNLHTALYYKAGGVPWRLPRRSDDLTACFVGVSFYRNPEDDTLQTSVAQIFNQRGDGMIVRGGPAERNREDRQPHLSAQHAQALLSDSLKRYRTEHRTIPARVVLHKTSSYTQSEIEGFQQAADDAGLEILELIWIPSGETLRLFRRGANPPLRGTLLTLDEQRHVLYTYGSVPFYRTYPGHYIPVPLAFRTVSTESSPEQIGDELLALTKMNWNQTQMNTRKPITLETTRKVGDVLRRLPRDVQPQGRYAFYM